jgi:hypothetical protein
MILAPNINTFIYVAYMGYDAESGFTSIPDAPLRRFGNSYGVPKERIAQEQKSSLRNFNSRSYNVR